LTLSSLSLSLTALSLLNHPSNETLLNDYPFELGQTLWNIGVFFLLYCLYGTRPDSHTKLRIRVSPEIWFELLLAYQRLKALGRISLQAMKVFHKLQIDSAFQFTYYSGGPSLCRVVTILEEVRGQRDVLQRRRYHPQYFQILVSGNEYLSSHAEELSRLVFDGFGNHLGFLVSQMIAPIDATLLESDEGTQHSNMTQEMRDFFGLPEEDERDTVSEVEEVEEETPLSLLEQLERDTVTVLGRTSNDERDEVVNEPIKKGRMSRRKVATNPSSGRRVAPAASSKRATETQLSLLEQLEQDSMEVLGRDMVSSPNVSITVTRHVAPKTNRKKNHVPAPQLEDHGADEMSVLEQLEMESMEVLGESPSIMILPKVARASRKKVTEKTPRRKTPPEKKTLSSKVVESETTGASLSLLEQLERDTMEVLRKGGGSGDGGISDTESD
jgi:hypothetical protein